MCDDGKRRGTATESVQNLRQQMPLRRKMGLFLRNNWRKVQTRSDCCGNYGEPGC
jgi:hypothetical protein